MSALYQISPEMEARIRHAIENICGKGGAYEGRSLLFPDARSLDEIFCGVSVDGEQKTLDTWISQPYNKHHGRKNPVGRDTMHISNRIWAFQTRFQSALYFNHLTDGVIDELRNHMIIVDRDQISFELVSWPDNMTLVIAKHNRIIGSRWLAVIDSESLNQVRMKGA